MARQEHSDLYQLPPEHEKVAGTKMPPNTELWSEAVFGVFSEQWPDLEGLSNGTVNWDDAQADEEYGFGTGSIIVNSGSAIIKVPIIVKDYHLLPIDIFEADGKMQLLNEENIGAALKEQDSVGTMSYPERTDFKTTGFVNWLTKGATVKAWEKRVTDFTKIAKRIGGPYVDQSLQYFNDAPIQISEKTAQVVFLQDTKKLGQLNMIGYKDGKVVQIGPVNHDDLLIANNKNLKEASIMAFKNGYSICPMGQIKEAEVGYLGVDATKELGLIDKPGVYSSKMVTGEGVKTVPVFAMNILQLGKDTLPENPRMVFVVGGGEEGLNYALQDSAVGKAQSSDKFDFSDSMVPLSDADRFDKGFIIYDNGDGVKSSSGLVTIDRIDRTPSGRLRIFMKTPEGSVHYLLEDSFERILPLASDDVLHSENYNLNLTGPNLSFLKVGDPVELVSSLDKHQLIFDDAVVKAARNTSSMSVRYFKETNKIMAKIGSDEYEDSPERFMARMLSLGIVPEKSAVLINHVKTNVTPVQVIGILPDKVASKEMSSKDLLDVMGMLDGMREGIIKAAAAIEASGGEEQAAAAVLGVGMIGEENLRYFLQVVPTLEDVTNILAKMLYSSRIGDIRMDEGAVKSALVNVTQIIGKLKAISARV